MKAICALTAAAAVWAAACGPKASVSPQVQTLRVAYQATSEVSSVMSDMLFADRLVTIDWRGRPTLQLASDYRWTDDGTTLEFTLRRGVKFHDGSSITAAAVAETIRTYAQKYPARFEFVARVENADDATVLIHLKRPDTFLLEAVAGIPILDPNNPDNGTGPFKILKREPAIEGVRNPQYYLGTPGIERVQITTYDTTRAAWAAMMRGEVDMVSEVNRDSVEFLEGTTRFQTYSSIRPFYIPLVFNLRHAVLRNATVRRALAQAIDRDEIVRRALRGHGQVADDPVWPFHWAYATAPHRHSYNPTAAAQQLDAAGFPVRQNNSAERMPSRFQLRCLFWDKGPQYERIALMLQRQLASIGIDLILEPADQSVVQERVGKGEFDTYLYQLASGKSFEYTYLFWHSARPGKRAVQNSGYSGADEILDRLRQARSDGEIRVAVADLRDRFYEDAPAAFIAWMQVTRAVDARFDVGNPSDPEILANLWRWKPRAARAVGE